LSGWLVAATGIAYAWVSIEQGTKGNISLCIVYAGYAFSNVGLWLALK
jgi:hypothetical protein